MEDPPEGHCQPQLEDRSSGTFELAFGSSASHGVHKRKEDRFSVAAFLVPSERSATDKDVGSLTPREYRRLAPSKRKCETLGRTEEYDSWAPRWSNTLGLTNGCAPETSTGAAIDPTFDDSNYLISSQSPTQMKILKRFMCSGNVLIDKHPLVALCASHRTTKRLLMRGLSFLNKVRHNDKLGESVNQKESRKTRKMRIKNAHFQGSAWIGPPTIHVSYPPQKLNSLGVSNRNTDAKEDDVGPVPRPCGSDKRQSGQCGNTTTLGCYGDDPDIQSSYHAFENFDENELDPSNSLCAMGVMCDGHDGLKAAELVSEYLAAAVLNIQLTTEMSMALEVETSSVSGGHHSDQTNANNTTGDLDASVLNETCSNDATDNTVLENSFDEVEKGKNPPCASGSKETQPLSLRNFDDLGFLDMALSLGSRDDAATVRSAALRRGPQVCTSNNPLVQCLRMAINKLDNMLAPSSNHFQSRWDCPIDDQSGCCFVSCLFDGRYVVTAGVGDCQAMAVEFDYCRACTNDLIIPSCCHHKFGERLSIGGIKMKAYHLNKPHRADDPDELDRILALADDGIIDGRLLGIMEPTRAVGDWDIKTGGGMGLLIVDPHVTVFEPTRPCLTILATDGVWDVLTPMSILNIVHEHLSRTKLSSKTPLPSTDKKSGPCQCHTTIENIDFAATDLTALASRMVAKSRPSGDDRSAVVFFQRYNTNNKI